jgi:bifunctional DNA-binding transcriptional regulator/antitoxin component of YhaV-PrlF toxin-antitoxin module
MSVVKIDGKGRMTIPKALGLKETRAIIIPAGSFFVVVPIPKKPLEVARQWLSSDRERRDLKELAEDAAMEDASKRAERRKQD